MTHDPIDLQAAIREAAQHISAEARAAIDLYVLEQGPLRLEREGGGYKFVARQEVRLRLKEAEEIRADERERAAERVAAALAAGLATSSDGALYYIELDEDDPSCGYDVTFPKDSLVAAARGGE